MITDFDIHALWLCRNFERYFVAIEEGRYYLESLGFPTEKINVSGIPIDPKFGLTKSKKEMRYKYGLVPDLPTIILSLGGFGVGKIQEMIRSLRLIRISVQILAMCGRNEELRAKLEKELTNDGDVRIFAVGYTQDMDEYMSASDLIVGKPGGLTTCEALAKGLGFVIVNPIPGQEERNSDHLLENGCAVKSNNPATLAFKIEKLLADPQRIKAMSENALRFARPDAAKTIAETIKARSALPH